MEKLLLAIHHLTLREVKEKLLKARKENKQYFITTYSLQEFLNKLSFIEKIEWELFIREINPRRNKTPLP